MSAFSDSISTLCTSTDQVSTLCRKLLELNAGHTAVERLEDLSHIIEELCGVLDQWLSRTSAGNLQANFSNIRRDLEEIYKVGIRFRVVATLTAINTARSASGIDGFVQELGAVPDQIKGAVESLLARLKTVDAVVTDAITTAKSGQKFMADAKAGLLAQSGASQVVFEKINQAQTAMENIGTSFLNESQDETKALVRGFQYSDFFAQRLDHVAQMPRWEQEYGPAVRLLAASQLSALADHGRSTVQEIEGALRSLSGIMTHFMTNFSKHGGQDSDGNSQLRAIFQNVLTSREQALPRIATSVANSRRVLDEIGLCNDSFDHLVQMSGVMDLAAINARIRAARQDNAQKVMAFLSSAVIEGANTCREVLAKSSERLSQVAAVQDAQMLDQLLNCVDRFKTAFETCEAELAASELRVEKLTTTLQSVAQLIGTAQDMVQACAQTVQNLTQIIRQMSDMSRRLSAGATPPATWPLMDEIYALYTIQAERDTHDTLIGRPLTAPPPAALPELDDIFF